MFQFYFHNPQNTITPNLANKSNICHQFTQEDIGHYTQQVRDNDFDREKLYRDQKCTGYKTWDQNFWIKFTSHVCIFHL